MYHATIKTGAPPIPIKLFARINNIVLQSGENIFTSWNACLTSQIGTSFKHHNYQQEINCGLANNNVLIPMEWASPWLVTICSKVTDEITVINTVVQIQVTK